MGVEGAPEALVRLVAAAPEHLAAEVAWVLAYVTGEGVCWERLHLAWGDRLWLHALGHTCSWAAASPTATPLPASSATSVASHEAHLNRLVSLGVLPPLLARISAAVDQVGTPCCWPATGCLSTEPPTCIFLCNVLLPTAGHAPATSHHRCSRTRGRGGRCSSRCCARWATLPRAGALPQWTSCWDPTPRPPCRRWSPVQGCALPPRHCCRSCMQHACVQ